MHTMIDMQTSTLGFRFTASVQRFTTGERFLFMAIGTPRRKQGALFTVEQLDMLINDLTKKRDELDAMCGPVP